MGQYYSPTILADAKDENGHEIVEMSFYSHDTGNGLKLMEHSWIDNDFVRIVVAFLDRPRRLVWAGDYADPEPGRTYVENGSEYDVRLYSLGDGKEVRPYLTVGNTPVMGVDVYKERGARYSDNDVNVEMQVDLDSSGPRFFINHDKGEYVDIEQCPPFTPTWSDGPLTVHPLPLLTCEGNGRGGGDYHSYSYDSKTGKFTDHEMPGADYIGTWARDHIQASNTRPEGMVEIRPGFSEDPALIKRTTAA